MDTNVNLTFKCKLGPEALPTDIETFGKSQYYQNIVRELRAWEVKEIVGATLTGAGKTVELPITPVHAGTA